MIFNLAHLRFFHDAAMTGSVTEAAKRNSVSQSALSQGIRKLETDLGVELITHQRNRFRLTEEGRVVLRSAQRIFSGVDEMKLALEECRGEVTGTAAFACTNSLARCLVPDLLLQMQTTFPKVDLRFHRGSMRFIKESLEKERVEFGVVLDKGKLDLFEKQSLRTGNFRVYQKYGARVHTGESGIYVDHVESSEVQQLLEVAPVQILGELSGWGVVEQFVKKGLGLGLLPDFLEASDHPRSIEPVDMVQPDLPYSIVAIWPKGHRLSKAAEAAIELLHKPSDSGG